jgi:tetratricopeptide (TPR) repeat protein
MLIALALCLALMSEPPADPSDEARALFEQGQAKYETHDYDGAIDSFTAAFAKAEQIDDDDVRDEVLARLGFNLARAHVSAFDIDQDIEHLGAARRLVADFRGHERALGRDPDTDTDLQRLEAELFERERELAKAERAAQDSDQDPDQDAAAGARTRRKRAAGISLLVLSAPFAGLTVTSAILGAEAKSDFQTVTTGDARRTAQTLGRTSDLLFGLGIGLAVISAATGATLLGLSAKSTKAQVSARATLGGFVLEGKF